MTRSLLVYDGSRELFRAVADALASRSDHLEPVPWSQETVQRFLEAQFGHQPFAFILIEGDSIHVGAETVERVLRDQGLPESVTGLVKRAYPAVADPFGRAVHGQEPADIDGTFPLEDEARPYVETLRQRHTIPVDAE